VVSLYAQLISEISHSKPQLSSREIADQISILIEKEILPAAIVSARLRSLPSPIEVKVEELTAPRYGESVRALLPEKVRFIQELERLRVDFDGSDSTYEDFFAGLMDNTQIPFGQKAPPTEPNGKAIPDKPDVIQERLKTSPFLEKPEISEKPSRLMSFDSIISEKITCSHKFEKAVGGVESQIRRNYDRETLNIFFAFSIRTDMYDPAREKTIIRINLPDMNFDEKMKFWDKIEADIRDVIGKLDMTESERKEFNRNLFIHIEPT